MREALLAKKAEEIRAELERWATSHSLLKPGEQIAFSMHIDGIPIVVRKSPQNPNLLDLSPSQFFTAERLQECGADNKALLTRIHNTLMRAAKCGGSRKRGENEPIEIGNMHTFLRRYPTEQSLFIVRNMGMKSALIIMKALEPLRA